MMPPRATTAARRRRRCAPGRQRARALRHGYDGARLWVFTHQAVIMSFRYVLEGLSEDELLDIDRREPLPNASRTTYRRDGERLQLVAFADTAAVDATGADVTREESRGSEDAPGAT